MASVSTGGFDAILVLSEQELARQVLTGLLEQAPLPFLISEEVTLPVPAPAGDQLDTDVAVHLELEQPAIKLALLPDGAPALELTFRAENGGVEPIGNGDLGRRCQLVGTLVVTIELLEPNHEDGVIRILSCELEWEDDPANRTDHGGAQPETSREAVDNLLPGPLDWDDIRGLVTPLVCDRLDVPVDLEFPDPDPGSFNPSVLVEAAAPVLLPDGGGQPRRVAYGLSFLRDDQRHADRPAPSLPPDEQVLESNETTALVISSDYILRAAALTAVRNLRETTWEEATDIVAASFAPDEPCRMVQDIALPLNTPDELDELEARLTGFHGRIVDGTVRITMHVEGRATKELPVLPDLDFPFTVDSGVTITPHAEEGRVRFETETDEPEVHLDRSLVDRVLLAVISAALYVAFAPLGIAAIVAGTTAINHLLRQMEEEQEEDLSSEPATAFGGGVPLGGSLVVYRAEFDDLVLAGQVPLVETTDGSIAMDGYTHSSGHGFPIPLPDKWKLEFDLDLRRVATPQGARALDSDDPDVMWKAGDGLSVPPGTEVVDFGTLSVWRGHGVVGVDGHTIGQADVRLSLRHDELPAENDLPEPSESASPARLFGDEDRASQQVRVLGVRSGEGTYGLLWLWRHRNGVVGRYRLFEQDIPHVRIRVRHDRECVNPEVLDTEVVMMPALAGFGLLGGPGAMGTLGRADPSDADWFINETRRCTYRHTFRLTGAMRPETFERVEYRWTVRPESGEAIEVRGEVALEVSNGGEVVARPCPSGDDCHLEVTADAGWSGSVVVGVRATLPHACLTYASERTLEFVGEGVERSGDRGMLEEMRRRVDILEAAAAGEFDGRGPSPPPPDWWFGVDGPRSGGGSVDPGLALHLSHQPRSTLRRQLQRVEIAMTRLRR